MENNLNSYFIFYTVAKHGNISLAAKELFISQPAVSKTISRLEESLHTPLFIRSSKGVKLTPEGELLFRQAAHAFLALKAGEEQLIRRQELGMGQLSIGVSNTLCKYILLPYLQDFIKAHPHIQISIACQSSFHTIEALRNQSADIGLIGEPLEKCTDLTFYPVADIQDSFVTTKSYLENLKKRTAPKEHSPLSLLSHAALMMLDKENLTRQYIDRHLKSFGLSNIQMIEVSSMDLLIDFVKIDLGVACVIEEFIKKELEEETLIRFPLPFSVSKRKIGFACMKQKSLSNPVNEFMNYMQSQKPDKTSKAKKGQSLMSSKPDINTK